MRFATPIGRAAVATLVVAALGACSGHERPEALLAKAHASIAAADPKGAEIHLKNLLQADDRNAEAHFLLAGLYRAANDIVSAETEYRRARDFGFDRDRVLPPLLDSMYRLGRYREVVADAKAVGLRDPLAQAQILTTAGHAHLRLGQAAEAGRSFAAALAARSDHLPAQVGAASVTATQDRAAARVQVDAILRRDAGAVDAMLLKAELELADRRLDDAGALYAKVAALSPGNLESRARLVTLALDLGDVASAKSRLDELRRIAPGTPATHYLRALVDARENRLEPARDAVREALRLAPDYLPAVGLAAALSLSLNTLDQAERHARTLVERAPDSVIGYRLLGATYLRMNSPDRALEAVRPALEWTSADATILSIAGEAALKVNEPATAAVYFERASLINPGDAHSRTGLGLSRLAAGEQARGIVELEQAVELDSKGLQADIALAMAHLRERQFDKALAAVLRMERKAPASPVPASLRGSVLSARGDIAGARIAFDKALALDPAFFPAAANLAALDLRDNRHEDARQRYEAVLARDPKNSQAAVAIATLIARSGGSREQVLGELKKAREANPAAMLPILATARYLIDGNAPAEAIALLQEALARDPENTRLLDLMAVAFARSGQRSQAIAAWGKVLRIDPKAAIAQFRIGETQWADGDRDAALASFRKAAAIAPDAAEPQVGIAMALQQQGRTDEAMRIASRLRADERHRLAGTALEGDLLAAGGKWREAAERYLGAFAQQRSLAFGVKAHRALRAAGRDSDADRFLRDWIRAEPANLPVRLFAGESETARRRWKQAFEHYAVVLEREPGHALALNNAAWALHELKDERALDHARRAWEAAPRSASVLDTYGVILSTRGDPKGLAMLRQAVQLAPADPQMRLHLAEALARANDKAGARTQIAELLKSTPHGESADSARALEKTL